MMKMHGQTTLKKPKSPFFSSINKHLLITYKADIISDVVMIIYFDSYLFL